MNVLGRKRRERAPFWRPLGHEEDPRRAFPQAAQLVRVKEGTPGLRQPRGEVEVAPARRSPAARGRHTPSPGRPRTLPSSSRGCWSCLSQAQKGLLPTLRPEGIGRSGSVSKNSLQPSLSRQTFEEDSAEGGVPESQEDYVLVPVKPRLRSYGWQDPVSTNDSKEVVDFRIR